MEDRDATTGLPAPVDGYYHFAIEAHIPAYNSAYGLPIDGWYLQDNMGLVGLQDVPLGIQNEEFAKQLDEWLAHHISIKDREGHAIPIVVGTPNYEITDAGEGVLPYNDGDDNDNIWTKLDDASDKYSTKPYIVYIAHRVGGDALHGYTIFCRFWLFENSKLRDPAVQSTIEAEVAKVSPRHPILYNCYGYDSVWTQSKDTDLTITYSVPKKALDDMIANYLKAHPESNQVDGYLGGLRALKNTIVLANWGHMLSGECADLDSDYAHIHFQGTLSKTMIQSPDYNNGIARFEIRLNENHMDLNEAQDNDVDYYELSDEMTGLVLPDDDSIDMEVIAIPQGATETLGGVTLEKGEDYLLIPTDTPNGSSFTLRIMKGEHVNKDDAFVIRYNAIATGDTISNVAKMTLFGQEITATSGTNVRVSVNASVGSARLQARKTDAENPNSPVQGATYGLFTASDAKIFTTTTDADGIADFSGASCIYHKLYYIQETKPADGNALNPTKYALNPTKYWVVFCNTPDACEVCNKFEEAHSTLQRILPNTTSEEQDPIAVVDSPAAEVSLKVNKTVSGVGAPVNVSFKYTLTFDRAEPSQITPYDVDTIKNGVTVNGENVDGAKTKETLYNNGATFGPITFQYPGTYVFKITEDTTKPPEHWTYDDHYWLATITVEYADGTAGKLEVTDLTYTKFASNDPNNAVVDTSKAAASFTNTYTLESVRRFVQKIWVDGDNQDRLRPGSIQVRLTGKAGTQVTSWRSVTLSAANNWTYTWENLPEKWNDCTNIDYTVEELNVPEGYKSEIKPGKMTSTSTDQHGIQTTTEIDGFIITNTHEPETVDHFVQKIWEDGDNQDGLQPESIEVQLKADGKEYGAPVTLSAANNWTYTWENLPKKAAGEDITYSVAEVDVPEGYTSEIKPGKMTRTSTDKLGIQTTTEIEGFIITNTHEPETVDRFVQKIWEDGNDQDGLQPESIEVQLKADGKEYGAPVTLSAANNWTYTWENLPKKAAGKEITYSVAEVKVPDGYTSEAKPGKMTSTSTDKFGIQTTTKIDGFIITNTHEPETVDHFVQKIWEDAENQDGIRPTEISVQLLADGAAYGPSVTLNAGNNWTYVWENLPKNVNDGTGFKEIIYSVAEVKVPEGYTPNMTSGTMKRESMTRFGDITETVIEGFIITNTYTPETVEKTVTKVWKDEDDQDGIRPDGIDVTLVGTAEADGAETEVYRQSVTLNESNEWTYTWTNLPKYVNGTEITYSVAEVDVPDGYESAQTIDEETGKVTITNTHTPDEVEKSVTKVWDDNDDQDGLRKESIQVQLYADGEAYGEAVELSEENDWTYTWTNLPKNVNDGSGSKEITYTVEETEVPAGYEVSYATTTSASLMDGMPGPQTTGFIITNTHVPGTVSRFVEKVWADGENQDGIRPASVRVRLTGRAGEQITSWRDATLSADNGWRHEWTNLPENWFGGEEITYTVEELDVPDGYAATYAVSTDASLEGGMPGPQMAGYVITNTHTPEVVEKTVTKVWADNGDSDGLRPESIQVQLLANGEAYGAAVELNDANDWSYTWTSLPKKANGTDIIYTVTELSVLTDYTTTYDQATLTITNAYTPKTVSRTVVKVWNDNNDQDGVRATQITARLLADGEPYNSESVTGTVVLSAANNWQYTWENLPRYRDGGVEIVYSVEEVELLDGGYTATYGQTGTTLTITNTHTPSTTFRTVTKVWDDEDDAAGLRTPSVTVQLRDNGANLGAPVVLSEANDWSARWDNLPEFRNGQRINYTVVELNGPAGYTTTYGQNGTAFTVTNHYRPVPNAIDLTGTKIWVDGNNARGLRPNAIEVTLYQNGTATANVPEWTKNGNTWTFRFANLPRVDENGTPYVYTVRETPVDGYTMSLEGTTITNTIIPRQISIEGRKIWDDNDDAAGLRPTAITVRLLRDGTVIEERRVTAANDWRYSFEDLPESDPATGRLYVYTISERMVNGYYARVEGYNLVNRLLPTPPPTPDNLTTIQNYEPPLGLPTEEELEDMVELLDYGTPLWGDLLGTGDELPVYPFVFGGVGLLAVLALILGRKKRKKEQ